MVQKTIPAAASIAIAFGGGAATTTTSAALMLCGTALLLAAMPLGFICWVINDDKRTKRFARLRPGPTPPNTTPGSRRTRRTRN